MVVALLSFLVTLAAEGKAEFPLKIPTVATSSFGEYRPGRLHVGLDLRTGGIGVPVYAAEDGYVERLRCSPYGYGKAVYLRGKSGYLYVYGHLDDYNDALRACVRKKQHEIQQYTVDFSLPPETLPVRRGELIAKSGKTGIGAPHLHFEVRNQNGEPVDPRQVGVSLPDKTPPQITRIALIPLEPTSRINGSLSPTILSTDADRSLAITAQGKIGIAIEVVDLSANVYKLGIYSAELFADRQPLFRLQYDTLPYETLDTCRLNYHPFLQNLGRFLTLWRWEGNRCASHRDNTQNGVVDTSELEAPLRIRVTDFAGNSSEKVLTLTENPVSTPASPTPDNASPSARILTYGTFLLAEVTLGTDGHELPTGTVEIDKTKHSLNFEVTHANRAQAVIPTPKNGIYHVRIHYPPLGTREETWAVLLGDTPSLFVEQGPFRAAIPAEAAYGRLFAGIDRIPKAAVPALPDELTLLSEVFALQPVEMPLAQPIRLVLSSPEHLAHADTRQPNPTSNAKLSTVKPFLAWNRGGGWSMLNTRVDGDTFQAEPDGFGYFALVTDTQPPRLRITSPQKGFIAKSKRPRIEGEAVDGGAGLESCTFYVNDQWLLTAYDPEEHRVWWERDEDLPAGKHTLRLVATDRAGNRSEHTIPITIP